MRAQLVVVAHSAEVRRKPSGAICARVLIHPKSWLVGVASITGHVLLLSAVLSGEGHGIAFRRP